MQSDDRYEKSLLYVSIIQRVIFSLVDDVRRVLALGELQLNVGVGWRNPDSPYWQIVQAVNLPLNAISAKRVYTIVQRLLKKDKKEVKVDENILYE